MPDITRRAFTGSATAALIASQTRAESRPTITEIKAISTQSESYHGWATLARRRNGELLVAYSGAREAHVCPFGRVEVIRSADQGAHWSWPQVILDTPIDDRDAGICETAKGSLLVTTFTSLAYLTTQAKATDWPADKVERWASVARSGSPEQYRSLLGTWMVRSTDGGMTWSAPYRVPVNSPHGPSSLSDGRLVYAGKQLWEAGRKNSVCESTDDGLTWRWLSDIPTRPGDAAAEYHELHQVEAVDGRIIVQIRNHNRQSERETLQCESEDGGKTWTTPHPIGVWGLPSHLLRLKNGWLVMSYGYRRPPFGNHVRISRDGARTWSDPIVLSDDGAGVDLGYPSTVELDNGSLITVWYELLKGSTKAVLRMARWSPGVVPGAVADTR
ncbi:MAG TPA: sialidase family protein, partial [Bryobacteraceae bacterium]|nr:sialidase family protein [Bryobacteraceae bacterium]